jgi:septum formation protein
VSGFPEDKDWRDFQTAEEYALFNAEQKLKNIESSKVIIVADTVVSLNNEVFEKPSDREDLKRMMRAFSGKTHEIMTALIVKGLLTQTIIVKTQVTMVELTEADIECIADSPEEWFNHAGGYSIDGRLGCTIFKGISGCFHNVIGLPTFHLARFLMAEQEEYEKSSENN